MSSIGWFDKLRSVKKLRYASCSSFKKCKLPHYMGPYWSQIFGKHNLILDEEVGNIGYLTIHEGWVVESNTQGITGIHTEPNIESLARFSGKLFPKGKKKGNLTIFLTLFFKIPFLEITYSKVMLEIRYLEHKWSTWIQKGCIKRFLDILQIFIMAYIRGGLYTGFFFVPNK